MSGIESCSTPQNQNTNGPSNVLSITPPNWNLRTETMVASGLLLFLFLVYSHVAIWHSDVWAHLKHGQWIVEHKQLPDSEPFSPFSNEPEMYVPWLAQVIYYSVYQTGAWLAGGNDLRQLAGGVTLLQLLHGVVVALRFAFLFVAFRRLANSAWLAILGIFLVLAFNLGLLGIQRPEKFGEFYFAMLMVPLARRELSRRAMFLLPVLFVLWANTHGSFLIGLGFMGVLLVGRVAEWCWAQKQWSVVAAWGDLQTRRFLVILLGATVAVSLLNPHGPLLLWKISEVSQHPNVATMKEWAPLDFTQPTGGHLGWLMVLGLVVGTQVFSPRWMSPTQLLLLVVFALPPLLSQRLMSWWVMVLPWVVLPLWQAIGDRWAWKEPLRNLRPNHRNTMIVVGFVGVAIMWSPAMTWVLRGHPTPLSKSLSAATPWRLAWQLQRPDNTRVQAYPKLDAVLAEWGDANKKYRGCIWASESVADFLLWRLADEIPLVVYSHVHLFSADHWERHLQIARGQNEWETLLEDYQVNLVVFEPALWPQLAQKIRRSDNWTLLVDETRSPEKRNPRTQLLIAVRNKHVEKS